MPPGLCSPGRTRVHDGLRLRSLWILSENFTCGHGGALVCDSANPCPSGFTCVEDGCGNQCVPTGEIESEEEGGEIAGCEGDCGPCGVCVDGECQTTGEDECGIGYPLEGFTCEEGVCGNQCVPVEEECEEDRGPCMVCVNGSCVGLGANECGDSMPCSDGFICVQGECGAVANPIPGNFTERVPRNDSGVCWGRCLRLVAHLRFPEVDPMKNCLPFRPSPDAFARKRLRLRRGVGVHHPRMPRNQPSEDEGGESTNETGECRGMKPAKDPAKKRKTRPKKRATRKQTTTMPSAMKGLWRMLCPQPGWPRWLFFILLALGGWLGFHSSRKQRLGTIAGR